MKTKEEIYEKIESYKNEISELKERLSSRNHGRVYLLTLENNIELLEWVID